MKKLVSHNTPTYTKCIHCETPFLAKENERYCCNGCLYVAQLIDENGLNRFYELKGSTKLPPIGSKVFQDADVSWIEEVQAAAEAATEAGNISQRFSIEGISCIACVWLIEAIFKQQSGGVNVCIDARAGIAELSWRKGSFDLAGYARELKKIGYELAPYSANDASDIKSKKLVQKIGLCGFFLMNTMLFTLPGYLGMRGEFFLAPLFQILGALFATLSLCIGGGYFIHRAWQALHNRVLHIDLPIAIGLLAAYAGSIIGCLTGHISLIYFDFVSTFVFLMLVGRWLQEYALAKNRNHMQKRSVGPQAVTLCGGAEDGKRVEPDKVQKDHVYSVAPGEVNPVAAEPLEAGYTMSLEWINGEAEPVIWNKERIAPAGAINVGLKSAHFKARENWKDSLLAQLLQRPPDTFRETRLQKILKWYIGVVLVVAFCGGLSWLIGSGSILNALQVMISVLIVSCPCALGIALPMCDEFATARLRKAGLFIKNSQIWNRIRKVNTLVFDKTGTLTMDVPRLSNQNAIRELDLFASSALYQLVDTNCHPIARSLRESLLASFPHLSKKRNQRYARSEVRETPGSGVEWVDACGQQWTLGKTTWKTKQKQVNMGTSRSVLRQNGLDIAEFHFVEDIRDNAKQAIEELVNQNYTTVILSGDAPARVHNVANQLGLTADLARSECSPQDKADWIRENARGTALMIGDGANDSLAFDNAVCRGTPVVDRSILEASADFFFFGRTLECLPLLFRTALSRRHTVAVIFLLAVTYNASAVTLCLMGKMHPLLAAILMPLSSIATLGVAWLGLGRKNSSDYSG